MKDGAINAARAPHRRGSAPVDGSSLCPTQWKHGDLDVEVGHRRCSLSRRVDEAPMKPRAMLAKFKGVWGQA